MRVKERGKVEKGKEGKKNKKGMEGKVKTKKGSATASLGLDKFIDNILCLHYVQ